MIFNNYSVEFNLLISLEEFNLVLSIILWGAVLKLIE